MWQLESVNHFPAADKRTSPQLNVNIILCLPSPANWPPVQLLHTTLITHNILSPTRADLEGAALPVHGEVLQVHDAVGADGQPLRVEHAPVGEQSADVSLVKVVNSPQ